MQERLSSAQSPLARRVVVTLRGCDAVYVSCCFVVLWLSGVIVAVLVVGLACHGRRSWRCCGESLVVALVRAPRP